MTYSNLSENPADRAKAILIHYLGLAVGNLTSDNEIEIANAIEHIIDAAVEKSPDHRIKRLEQQVQGLKSTCKESVSKLEKAYSTLFKVLEYLPQELVDEVDNLTDEIADYLSE